MRASIKKGEDVDISLNGDSGVISLQFENYCQEITAIEKKLRRQDLPLGKRERLEARLTDIQSRLMPKVGILMQ